MPFAVPFHHRVRSPHVSTLRVQPRGFHSLPQRDGIPLSEYTPTHPLNWRLVDSAPGIPPAKDISGRICRAPRARRRGAWCGHWRDSILRARRRALVGARAHADVTVLLLAGMSQPALSARAGKRVKPCALQYCSQSAVLQLVREALKTAVSS